MICWNQLLWCWFRLSTNLAGRSITFSFSFIFYFPPIWIYIIGCSWLLLLYIRLMIMMNLIAMHKYLKWKKFDWYDWMHAHVKLFILSVSAYKLNLNYECVVCCRTPEILNQLKLYFISVKAFPARVLLTGYDYCCLAFTLSVSANFDILNIFRLITKMLLYYLWLSFCLFLHDSNILGLPVWV